MHWGGIPANPNAAACFMTYPNGPNAQPLKYHVGKARCCLGKISLQVCPPKLKPGPKVKKKFSLFPTKTKYAEEKINLKLLSEPPWIGLRLRLAVTVSLLVSASLNHAAASQGLAVWFTATSHWVTDQVTMTLLQRPSPAWGPASLEFRVHCLKT